MDATPDDEIPDWLKSLRSDSGRGEEQIFQSEEASSSAAGQDLPDWLAGMRDDSSAPLEAPETGEEQVAQFGEAGPEWLQRLEPSTAPEPSQRCGSRRAVQMSWKAPKRRSLKLSLLLLRNLCSRLMRWILCRNGWQA